MQYSSTTSTTTVSKWFTTGFTLRSHHGALRSTGTGTRTVSHFTIHRVSVTHRVSVEWLLCQRSIRTVSPFTTSFTHTLSYTRCVLYTVFTFTRVSCVDA